MAKQRRLAPWMAVADFEGNAIRTHGGNGAQDVHKSCQKLERRRRKAECCICAAFYKIGNRGFLLDSSHIRKKFETIYKRLKKRDRPPVCPYADNERRAGRCPL